MQKIFSLVPVENIFGIPTKMFDSNIKSSPDCDHLQNRERERDEIHYQYIWDLGLARVALHKNIC